MVEAGEVKYFSFIKNREFGFEFEGEMALLRFDLRSLLKGVQKKPNGSDFVFLISRPQVLGSSKFLCLSPIIRRVLWG